MTQENRPDGYAAGNGGGMHQGGGDAVGGTGGPLPPIPGQPPQPPQPPGYAPAPGYAASPGYPPAPGYGVPPQGRWQDQGGPAGPPPGMPGPLGPSGPPPRRSGGKVAGIVIACVVALALLGGGFLYVLTRSGDSGGASADADVPASALDLAWKSSALPRSTARSGTGMQWPGRWTHRRTFVYGDENGVRGYDIETGKQRWKVKPPKGAGEPCAMSTDPGYNGVGAVVFDAGGDECSFLAAVDLDSGRVTWSKKLLSKYGENGPQVYVGDRYISVALNSVEGMKMFDVRTGAAADPFASSGIDCEFHFVFSQAYVVAKPECHDEMVVLDTQNGGDPVAVPHQKGQPVQILSDNPLRVVVTTGEDEDGPRQLLTLSDDGESFKTTNLEGTAARMVVRDAGNRITEDGLYFCKLNNGYNAVIDLTTGEAVWKAKKARTAFIGDDSSNKRMLIAVSDPETTYWTRVGTLDTDMGKMTYAGTMVMPDGSYLMQSDTLYAHESGKVLAVGPRSDGKSQIVAYAVPLPPK